MPCCVLRCRAARLETDAASPAAPSCAQVEWLNTLLGKLWPSLDDATCHVVRTSVERVLRRVLVGKGGISDVVFGEVTLGDVAPHLSGAKAHTVADNNLVVMDFEVMWSSQLAASLAVQFFNMHAAVPILLDGFMLRGVFRVSMGPLRGRFPLFEALDIQLTSDPQIDFRLSVVGQDVTAFRSLRKLVSGGVRNAITRIFQFPNKLHIPVMGSVAASQRVQGILYVSVKEVTKVRGRDMTHAKSHGRACLRVSLAINATEKCEETPAVAAQRDHQDADADDDMYMSRFADGASHTFVVRTERELKLTVHADAYNNQSLVASHPLAELSVPIGSLGWHMSHTLCVRGDHCDLLAEMAFYPSKAQCTNLMRSDAPLPTDSQPTAVERSLSSQDFDFNPMVSPQVLVVQLNRATRLRAADWGGSSDPYAVIRAGEQSFCTKTIYGTLDPVWDEVAYFPLNIVHKGVAEVHVEVFDRDMGFSDDALGMTTIKLANVDTATGKHPRTQFELQGRGARGEIELSLSLHPIVTDVRTTCLRMLDVVDASDTHARAMKAVAHRISSMRKLVGDGRRRSALCCGLGRLAEVDRMLDSANEDLRSVERAQLDRAAGVQSFSHPKVMRVPGSPEKPACPAPPGRPPGALAKSKSWRRAGGGLRPCALTKSQSKRLEAEAERFLMEDG